MTPRERKYHKHKKDAKFWKHVFIGDQPITVRSYMRVEEPHPGTPVTVTIHKDNFTNNLRHRIIPREEMLQHIFDLTFGKVSEN